MFGGSHCEGEIKMNCEEATKLIDRYLDSELDPITSQAIEKHLGDCNRCHQAYTTHGSLIRALGNATPYFKAPADLRERIQTSFRKEIAERPVRNGVQGAQPGLPKSQPRLIPGAIPWNWLALAAAIVLAAIIVFNLIPRVQQRETDQLLATQLIASHARSLLASHLTDVASSDQHTVKPWLDAKLDFAPAVVDLSQKGFPLIGGRLDYLDNRPVAALVYQRRQHFLNLFVWPVGANAVGSTKTMRRQGYQLLHWVDSDLNYWAVSDINEKELQEFKRLFEEQIAQR
jgi:anti-sigma factor RsiW